MTQVVSSLQRPPALRHSPSSHDSGLSFRAVPAGAPAFNPAGRTGSSAEPAEGCLALPPSPAAPPAPAPRVAIAEPPAPSAYGPATSSGARPGRSAEPV